MTVGKSKVMMETEIKVMWPQVEECELEEARKEFSQKPPAGTISANTLLAHNTFVLGVLWKTSNLQNCKRIIYIVLKY